MISNGTSLTGLYDRGVGKFGLAKVSVHIIYAQFGTAGNGKVERVGVLTEGVNISDPAAIISAIMICLVTLTIEFFYLIGGLEVRRRRTLYQ